MKMNSEIKLKPEDFNNIFQGKNYLFLENRSDIVSGSDLLLMFEDEKTALKLKIHVLDVWTSASLNSEEWDIDLLDRSLKFDFFQVVEELKSRFGFGKMPGTHSLIIFYSGESWVEKE